MKKAQSRRGAPSSGEAGMKRNLQVQRAQDGEEGAGTIQADRDQADGANANLLPFTVARGSDMALKGRAQS